VTGGSSRAGGVYACTKMQPRVHMKMSILRFALRKKSHIFIFTRSFCDVKICQKCWGRSPTPPTTSHSSPLAPVRYLSVRYLCSPKNP